MEEVMLQYILAQNFCDEILPISEADKRYKEAVKAVDQAAARGLLHKNTAANRKSKMTLRLNKIPQ